MRKEDNQDRFYLFVGLLVGFIIGVLFLGIFLYEN